MSLTSLLMKTLENAATQYAIQCVEKCALEYNFPAGDAITFLNLENFTLQVREMKKRSSGKKTKEVKEKAVEAVKEKTLKAVKEKPVKAVKEYKAAFPLPFVASHVLEDGCHGLAFNGGLFTQCQKIRMSQSSYCKGCQMEADGSSTGSPSNGTVAERCSQGLMDFRDSKGRAPIAYTKIMDKLKLTREQVEEEAGKLNIVIDDVHFAVVETKKVVTGRPKASKKKTVTVEAESIAVEDLFAQLVEEDSEEEDTATVLMDDSDTESVEDTKDLEKGERDQMKDADSESKKMEKAIRSAEKKAAEKAAKEQKIADEKAAKEQKIADEKAAKEQKIADELAAKEQKIADELAAKEAKKQQLEADKIAKAEKIVADKLAKEEKIAADKLAKEQKIAADKLAKEQKIAEELAAKEQKIADDLAAKEAKKQQLEADKIAKAEKIAADKIAKEQKIAEELAAKEAKKQQLEADRIAKEQKKSEPKAVAKKPEAKKPEAKKPEAKKPVAVEKAVEKAVEAPKTKVTVKRITIEGKQYLKTANNMLYDPETKEEMGIYDPETNTIKALPEESDEEVEEDGYDSE
jgi:hypothetical protein